ncbi:MAG: hypothetical protein DHS20C15_05270 [Planctomycetota bacterium]|nr:MAG: hypothetical protein DHS20C15_05270 [Planctomycetota bacterium]
MLANEPLILCFGRPRVCRGALSLALLLCLLAACGSEADESSGEQGPDDAERRPHVVLISIDTLRADHLSCYGYERETSPVLDALAEEAYLFENVIAASSSTGPSHTSLFTGVLPRVHGIYNERPALPSPNLPYLPEMMSKAGWRTAAFADGGILTSDYGFARGYQHFESVYEPFDQKLDDVEQWLQNAPDDPTFLFVHTYGVHAPYLPAPGHDLFTDPNAFGTLKKLAETLSARRDRGKLAELDGALRLFWKQLDRTSFSEADLIYLKALYDGAIHGVDAGVGRLLGALENKGWLDDAWVIVTSDHGEAFGEHGTFSHRRINQAELWVPLIVRPPGGHSGSRVSARVSHLDILPTLIELLGLRSHPALQGESLWPFESLVDDRRVLATEGTLRQDAVFDGGHKLITGAKQEPKLYAIDDDPHELTDLAADPAMRASVQALRALLDAMRSDAELLVERVGEPIVDVEGLDPERLAELRALGYLK